MMREKSRARRRVRTRVALFLSLASLAGLYLIRLLGAALHAFTTPDGLPMHTPQDAAAFFPRIPAIWDSELPSPAALLLHALALADACRPQAGYKDAALVLWQAAAPYARQQPLACAGLIDAAHFTLSESREAPPRPQ